MFKALIGAAVVVLLAVLSKTRNYYIAGLVPLFPTFALIAHYIVGKGRSLDDLKTTIVFGMWSIIPYFVYLAALYLLVERFRLETSLALAGGWPGRLGRLRGGLLGGGGSDSGFFAHAGLLPFYVFSYAVPHSMPLPEVVR